VAQFFCEVRSELDTPFAQRLMADLDAVLIQQFLHIAVAQRETVVQPNGVLDDGYWKAVAVRSRVDHGGSAYPSPIKATQPTESLFPYRFCPY